jgi:hypothetical protein
MYHGPTSAMVSWFNILGYPYDAAIHGNPADWVLDLVSLGFDKAAGDGDEDARPLGSMPMMGGLAHAVSEVEEGCHFMPEGSSAATVAPVPRMLAERQQQQKSRKKVQPKSCFEDPEDGERVYGPPYTSSSSMGRGLAANLGGSYSQEQVQDYVARKVTADALAYTMSSQEELEQAAAAFRYCQEQLQPHWFMAAGNRGGGSGLRYKSSTSASGRSYVSLTDLDQQSAARRKERAEAQPACGCFKPRGAEKVRAAATQALEEQLRLEDTNLQRRAEEENLRSQLAVFDTQAKRFNAQGHSLQVPASAKVAEQMGFGGAAHAKESARGGAGAAAAAVAVAVVSAAPASSASSSSPVNAHRQELVEREFSNTSSVSGFETAYSGLGQDVAALSEFPSVSANAAGSGRGSSIGSGHGPSSGRRPVGGGTGRGVRNGSYAPQTAGPGPWTWSPRSEAAVAAMGGGWGGSAAGRGWGSSGAGTAVAGPAVVKSGGLGAKIKQQWTHFKALAWRDYLMTTR